MNVCNNVDKKCYYINDASNLDNDITDACYLPTSCPQNCNTPNEWIFQIPTPYTTLQEYNDMVIRNRDDLEWIFRCPQ